MDPSAELESFLTPTEWEYLLDNTQELVEEFQGDTPNPPPPNAVPAEGGFDSNTQTLEGLSGYGGIPSGVAPLSLEQRNDQLDCPFNNNYQNDQHSGFGYSQGQFNNVPVVSLPQGMQGNWTPVGFVNGEVVYGMRPFTPPVPPQGISQRPYVRKPLNAFMIFRREQRLIVMAELNITNSATLNTVLGQRWRALSPDEQSKYYEEADKEKQLHAQLFPGWSTRDNYGKKRKRIRRKPCTGAEGGDHLPY